MEIIFHVHHAEISDDMRRRAERAARRVARRLGRAVDAIVRFEQDGSVRRVEMVLHAPRHRDLIAEARAPFFGVALKQATEKLLRQVGRTKRVPRQRMRARADALLARA